MQPQNKPHEQSHAQPLTRQIERGLSLAQFVERRNGVPLGHPDSLRNMLNRSFGATSFAKFWQYWNPIWGYSLGQFVYSPLQRVLPAVIALILTFVVSGAVHDLVTMALRRSVTFIFTPWFFVLGLGVVIGRVAGMDLSARPKWFRIGINFAYLIGALLIAIAAKGVLNIP